MEHRPPGAPVFDLEDRVFDAWHEGDDGPFEHRMMDVARSSQRRETGRNSAADGTGDGASRSQDLNDQPSPAPVDPIVDRWAPHWPAAPSLPMDLCSDIPEDDR